METGITFPGGPTKGLLNNDMTVSYDHSGLFTSFFTRVARRAGADRAQEYPQDVVRCHHADNSVNPEFLREGFAVQNALRLGGTELGKTVPPFAAGGILRQWTAGHGVRPRARSSSPAGDVPAARPPVGTVVGASSRHLGLPPSPVPEIYLLGLHSEKL